MTIDRATIINWALTEIGAGPMFSVDDDSDLAEMIENTWDPAVDRIFGMHDWSFARQTFKNARLDATPENGWRFGFDLPGNRIGTPLKIMDRAGQSPNPLRDFTIEAGKLYCNAEETWSLCKVAVDPDYWPPEWRGAFVVALAGYLAVPVWQDRDLRDAQLTEAFGTPSREGTGGLFGRLMAQDKAASPVGRPMDADNVLSNARYSGAGDVPWHGRF
jgi:hypothetical protein